MTNPNELLKEWLEMHNEPCWYDHHGYCQAHFLDMGENCIVARTKKYLDDHEKAMNWEGPGSR